MRNPTSTETLQRIHKGLQAAVEAISPFVPGAVEAQFKKGDDPVTEADRAANHALRNVLLRDGEGWFSEESVDDLTRFSKKHVWIVDPLDGTREFVQGIPEWCISVALIENRRAIAGGICNPATRETIVGAEGEGVTYNDQPVQPTAKVSLDGAVVLASRSEVKRGEWDAFRGRQFVVRPMGSVAYKLGLVAAGKADVTWTLTPKHEWDVAAGVALIQASGGFVRSLAGSALTFNNQQPLLPGLVAGGQGLREELLSLLSDHLHDH